MIARRLPLKRRYPLHPYVRPRPKMVETRVAYVNLCGEAQTMTLLHFEPFGTTSTPYKENRS